MLAQPSITTHISFEPVRDDRLRFACARDGTVFRSVTTANLPSLVDDDHGDAAVWAPPPQALTHSACLRAGTAEHLGDCRRRRAGMRRGGAHAAAHPPAGVDLLSRRNGQGFDLYRLHIRGATSRKLD